MESVYRSRYGNLYLSHSSHKYLKREWKNGKWNYTYKYMPTSEHLRRTMAENAASDLETYNSYANNANYHMNRNKSESKRYSSEIEKNKRNAASAHEKSKYYWDQYKEARKSAKGPMLTKTQLDYYKAKMAAEETERLSNKAVDDYKKAKDITDNLAIDNSYALKRYGRKAMSARYTKLKTEAENARISSNIIRKWEATPISKLQTAYHKSADAISKTLSKWKDSLVSAFTKKKSSKNDYSNVSGHVFTYDPNTGSTVKVK